MMLASGQVWPSFFYMGAAKQAQAHFGVLLESHGAHTAARAAMPRWWACRVRPGGLFGPLMGMSQNVWVGELRYLVSVLGV
jgi:hypothetical protein